MKRQTKSKPVLAALGLSRGKMRLRVIPCDWDSPILLRFPNREIARNAMAAFEHAEAGLRGADQWCKKCRRYVL